MTRRRATRAWTTAAGGRPTPAIRQSDGGIRGGGGRDRSLISAQQRRNAGGTDRQQMREGKRMDERAKDVWIVRHGIEQGELRAYPRFVNEPASARTRRAARAQREEAEAEQALQELRQREGDGKANYGRCNFFELHQAHFSATPFEDTAAGGFLMPLPPAPHHHVNANHALHASPSMLLPPAMPQHSHQQQPPLLSPVALPANQC
ncbi:hypothetical protein niasHS_015996 [Heterodera schachtii]